MSGRAEHFLRTEAEYVTALRETIPEHCASCVIIKLAALSAGKQAHAGSRTVESITSEFAAVASDCIDGSAEIGECGEKKTVCAHPLGSSALAKRWEN